VPNVRKVMSLILLRVFLMHGVVLQNRCFRTLTMALFYAEMFHVKHRGAGGWVSGAGENGFR
jgi:hypothetical protein